ncbi:hypothetical protein [Flavobacterium macrobrachii]|uniref:hypothetical protein n=1 Tax=Flavobacterium macrobrachii TaxID=591204 RepID=UPI003F6F44B0
MKKLFFSAVALIAFSSVSMAETKIDESKEVAENRCKSVFSAALNNALAAGYTADQSWAIASFSYDLCDKNVRLF